MQSIFKRFKGFKPRKVSQLTLKGFKVPAQGKINKFLSTLFSPLSGFIGAFLKYLVQKLKELGSLFLFCLSGIVKLITWAKEYSTRKLIWGRGRLGRPVANIIVLAVAFVVFTFGEILSSSKFVNSQEINPDYMSNVTDILPNRNTALTLVPDDRKRAESFVYNIQSGDTLSGIGQKFKISVDAIKYVNGLTDSSVLAVGDAVTIPPVSGLIHKVKDGDSLSSIAEKYDVAPQAIADFNYILDTSSLAIGSELVVPGAKVPQPVYIPQVPVYTPQTPLANVPNLGDGWVWPTSTRIITQYFAWYHNGLDIAVPWGWGMPSLYATSSGTVTRAGWDPWGLGLVVTINHGNGYESVYGHMSRIDVGYGEKVSRGEMVGLMGNTGRSTGPHVHFTIKANGVAQNPLNYVN
jgi:murein DD-endopeptidase MepM/ murein hydrolase activator NlpD